MRPMTPRKATDGTTLPGVTTLATNPAAEPGAAGSAEASAPAAGPVQAPPVSARRSMVVRPKRRKGVKRVPAGIAAGHPATTEVGLRVLAAGGSAADAAVAAVLTCCVSESVLTGIGGGGFATYFEASTGTVTCLDFFCAVPGLDGDITPGPMLPIEVSVGGVPMQYEIGEASVGVPGVPAGCGEVHRRWGRLPWHRVVAPAISLARSGVVLPAPQARTLISVAPALLPGLGASIYAP